VNDPDREKAHITEPIKIHPGKRDHSVMIRGGGYIYIYIRHKPTQFRRARRVRGEIYLLEIQSDEVIVKEVGGITRQIRMRAVLQQEAGRKLGFPGEDKR
jgi:hypothetical protein